LGTCFCLALKHDFAVDSKTQCGHFVNQTFG
jgi:hypothetical protein